MTETAQQYFQSKCSVCINYDKIDAHPHSSADHIKCPVGGEVTVASGCAEFRPSAMATCTTCWNLSAEEDAKSCSVHGILNALRESCPDAVERAVS